MEKLIVNVCLAIAEIGILSLFIFSVMVFAIVTLGG